MTLSPKSSRTYTRTTSAFSGLVNFTATTAKDNPTSDSARPRSNLIQGPSGALQVDDGGSGDVPLLFVHSSGESTEPWSLQLATIRHERRAIAVNLRTEGSSAVPTDVGDTFATDIGVVADSLGLQRFVLVGHSLVCAAAIMDAGAHPDRVAGLVLVDAERVSTSEMSNPLIASLSRTRSEGDDDVTR